MALALCGALTALFQMLRFQTQPVSTSMIYLLALLAVALNFGGGPAVSAALAAFAGLSILFAERLSPLPAYDPSDLLVMYTFLVVAVFTGQLAAMQRQRAREAERGEHEAIILSEIVHVLGGADLNAGIVTFAERLRSELSLLAVVVDLADGSSVCARVTLGDPEAVAAALAAVAPEVQGGTGRAGQRWRWFVNFLAGEESAATQPGRRALRALLTDAGGRPLGSITITRGAGSVPFSASEAHLLDTLATQLSTVSERERLRREATEGEILRRGDDLKTALLRAVSHDLRTPLASMLAAAGSLLEEQVGWTEQERRELATTIKVGAERLNKTVENLLDISSIESGSIHPAKDWYELWVLVDDVLERLRPLAGEHPIEVELPEELPLVLMDYVQISEVLVNLLENAIAYTPPGTEICISAGVEAEDVLIAVADRGPGIPVEALPRLFEPFYRLDQAGRRPQGVGLGLAVAKGLVEAHDGRIWAENRPGGGARFVFALPLGTLEQVPEELEEVGACSEAECAS